MWVGIGTNPDILPWLLGGMALGVVVLIYLVVELVRSK